MQFSLWMVEEALQPYRIERSLTEKVTRTIENIRLYAQGTQRRDDTLYVERSDVFFQDGDDTVICFHHGNLLRVQTASVTLVFNQILQFFEERQIWESTLNDRITSGCLLNDVLDHFREVLPLPLMVLDNGQIMLAHSEQFGMDSIDEEWNTALETGSFHIEKLTAYNQMHHARIRQQGNYAVPADPFPYASFNRNIYIDQEFVGFISLILVSEMKEVYEDWFDLACSAIMNWVKLYMQQNEIVMRREVLIELLEGHDEHLKQFSDAMNTAGWDQNIRKRILVLSCMSDVLNMNLHIARVLGQSTSSIYAIEHQNQIVAVIRDSLFTSGEFHSTVLSILEMSGYYGGISDPFTDYRSLPVSYRQARIAMEHGITKPGVIQSIQDHLFPYIFETLRNSADMDLCHPALRILSDYDRDHKTSLLHVLDVYLKSLGSQSASAKALFIHRSSLIRKLDRITELCCIDLNDYETRLHLMLSFQLLS